jgi:hypothetical protein
MSPNRRALDTANQPDVFLVEIAFDASYGRIGVLRPQRCTTSPATRLAQLLRVQQHRQFPPQRAIDVDWRRHRAAQLITNTSSARREICAWVCFEEVFRLTMLADVAAVQNRLAFRPAICSARSQWR